MGGKDGERDKMNYTVQKLILSYILSRQQKYMMVRNIHLKCDSLPEYTLHCGTSNFREGEIVERSQSTSLVESSPTLFPQVSDSSCRMYKAKYHYRIDYLLLIQTNKQQKILCIQNGIIIKN